MLRGFGSGRRRNVQRAAIAQGGTRELTRKQVASRLGIAETSVRRLEGTSLHPAHRGRFVFFDAQEVEGYAAEHGGGRKGRDHGEVAARAFELFRAGQDFRDVVIELRQSPERVRQLLREYALGSDLLIPAEILRQIEELGLSEEGQVLRAQDILHLLQRLAEGNRRLVQESINQWQRIQQLERALERAARAGAAMGSRELTKREGVVPFDADSARAGDEAPAASGQRDPSEPDASRHEQGNDS